MSKTKANIKVMHFKNPNNNYTEKVSDSQSWFWVLLAGPVYWSIKGIWRHVVASLLLIFITFGISHFVYPFYTYKIIENHYNKIGWEKVVVQEEKQKHSIFLSAILWIFITFVSIVFIMLFPYLDN